MNKRLGRCGRIESCDQSSETAHGQHKFFVPPKSSRHQSDQLKKWRPPTRCRYLLRELSRTRCAYSFPLSLYLRGDLTNDPVVRLQIRELVDYLARGLSDDDRQKSFGQILELVKAEQPPEGETPQAPPAISQETQLKVFSLLIPEVKGLGDGSEKGA